ncbi:MAG: hypothetical protein EOP83_01195 [Verrucomicrobiaceae bacterium]|nr:MAG: hypothetical protein EOP83_01195 [Verrucomicrobiaceae bacterium]
MDWNENEHEEIVALKNRVFELEREIDGHADILKYHEDYAAQQERYRIRAEKELQHSIRQAECYDALQKALLNNPILMEEWARLCMVMKLDDPNIEKFQPAPGMCYDWDTEHHAWPLIYGKKKTP